ncbi:hypothetical protein METHPM2_110018 [Pseudomonas sp. PM2]
MEQGCLRLTGALTLFKNYERFPFGESHSVKHPSPKTCFPNVNRPVLLFRLKNHTRKI